MNDDDRRLLSSWADHLSPTLNDNYDLVQKLKRVPLCVACPMAQWYKLETPPPKSVLQQNVTAEPTPPTLQCFCKAFHDIMYNGQRVVTACDAFDDARDQGDDNDGTSG